MFFSLLCSFFNQIIWIIASKIYSSLWKRVIAWERSRVASGYEIIWGKQIETNKEEFSAECHSVDCIVVTARF